MKVTVSDDPILDSLNPRPKKEFDKAVLKYAIDLVQEAGRLETRMRSTKGPPKSPRRMSGTPTES